MARKRIILLLDGTWNDADAGLNDTNIVRLRDAIARTLGASSQSHAKYALDRDLSQKIVSGYHYGDYEHYVYYQRGVGTGPLNRFSGGIFGEGLDTNVRRAYKFLSFYYEPGDQIFVEAQRHKTGVLQKLMEVLPLANLYFLATR